MKQLYHWIVFSDWKMLHIAFDIDLLIEDMKQMFDIYEGGAFFVLVEALDNYYSTTSLYLPR